MMGRGMMGDMMQSMMGNSSEESSKAASEHGKPLDEVLKDILETHNARTIQDLNCESLTDTELEELGEAVMSQMHPNQEMHERMDEMMGGEGSESLRQAHIRMGQNYLRCSQSDKGMGMMGGMMNMKGERGGFSSMMDSGSGMTGASFFGGSFGLIRNITWILVIVLLVVMIRYFWQKTDSKK